jgi:probable F420-dependent oxidoreductase
VAALPHHPFRFGVINFQFSSASELSDAARRHEDLGYSTFLLGDHTFNLAPFTGIAAAALATSHLRVGTQVLGNDFWQPAILAREALAIDLVSNGRLELGIGSGWYAGDYAKTGILMDSPAVRISRLEECLPILKGLLCGETVSFQGTYYHIDQLKVGPGPVQQPHPPLMIGGGGRRILSLAARQADIVGFNMRSTPQGGIDQTSVTLQATQQKVEWVCQAAGERLAGLEFSNLVTSVRITNDREGAAREIVKDWTSSGIEYTVADVLESPRFMVGEVEQIVTQLQENRARFGFSYIVIFQGAMESFAPVVQRLTGQ